MRVATKHRSPTFQERVASWTRGQSTTIKILFLLLLGAGLLFGLNVIYPLVPRNTFPHELIIASISAVLTVFTAMVAAAWALAGEIAKRREIKILEKIEAGTWKKRSISAGRLVIPDIVIITSSNDQKEWTERVTFEFEKFTDLQREVAPENIERAKSEIIRIEEARAKSDQLIVHDGECVDLRSAVIEMKNNVITGRRHPNIRLTPARSNYYEFLQTTANLDLSLTESPGQTLRSLANISAPQELAAVGEQLFIAKIGTVTLVQTADKFLVLGVRGKVMIAGQSPADSREAVHFVAEGVIPDDIDSEGRLSHVETARRALWEELGLGGESGRVGSISKIVNTGFFLDQQRMQPCFALLAKTELTFDELKTGASAAKDSWENSNLVCLPFTVESKQLRQLILGKHPDFYLASNHAAAGLWFALVHEHGFIKVRDELSRPVSG